MKRILKKWLQKVAVDKHGFEYTVRELVQMYEVNNLSTSWHGELLSDANFNYKRSDTIFLLGSGPSINRITAQQWANIKQHDSIGFNFWLAHKFIPTFYMLQLPPSVAYFNSLFALLRDKQMMYADVPFLIRGSALAKNG